MVRHSFDASPAAHPDALAFPFIEAMGGCALAAFFVASGFLLYRPFLSAHVAGQPRPAFGAYAMRRVLRIGPAYWVALTVATLWLSKPLVFGDALWQFYGGVYVYSGRALEGIGPAWSLCIEVAWYALLPLFVVAAARLGGASARTRLLRSAAAVAALGMLGFVSRVYFAERQAELGVNPNVIPVTFLDWIALGMGLAILSVWVERRRERLPRGLGWVDRFPGGAWAVAVVAYVVLATQFDHVGSIFARTGAWRPHVLYGVFAIALVLPPALGDQGRGLVRRVLANRVLLYLGAVSYGIFLWHMPILEQLDRWHLDRVDSVHPYLLWPLVTLALSTAIATVSHYAIERPSLRLRRRLRKRRAARQGGMPGGPARRVARAARW